MVVEHLDELYREVILDHFKSPRNIGELPKADIRAEGTNPLCGDEIAFTLTLQDGRVDQVRFKGKGCAISQATSSMLSERLQGMTLAEVGSLIEAMKRLMQGREPGEDVDLGDLESLSGVRKFPVRIKCAALSWNVLEQGLAQYNPDP
ncbi:MAG: SUF system NifU family Fe-S cluster assembly protein [Candidatus Omnitrophica bacterium]|nr:SUF system NifU family Fe-S cluster assembly protein [Candidatus Omnitrophota bacterium]